MERWRAVAFAVLGSAGLLAAGAALGARVAGTAIPTGTTTVTSTGPGFTTTIVFTDPTTTAESPPSAPTLTGAVATPNGVALSWDAPSTGAPITSYRIWRGTASGAEASLAYISPSSRAYTDTTVVKGVTYWYQIAALNKAGEGARSNELPATALGPTAPGAPTLTAATGGSNRVSLAWTAPSSDGGATVGSYRVYRGTSSGHETLLTTLGSVDTYADTSAIGGTTYYYEVTAVTSAGESPPSNELSATPLRALFQPYQATWVGSRPEAVAIGDVTGDGRNDVVLTTSFYFDPVNDYHVFVFAQRPDGTLAPPVSYLTGGSPVSVAIGDITGDGRADVVVGLDGQGVQVFPQLTSGALGSPTLTATPDSNKIRIGQLDGDGRLDVAGVGWGTNTVSVLLNDGNGGLRAPVVYPAEHAGYDDLEVGDVSGDGRDDLVVMSGQGMVPNISVLTQLPAGGFGAAAPYLVPSGTWDLTHGIGVGDVTGDGRNDVVASYGGNFPTSQIAVFAQTASGALTGPTSLPSDDIPEPVDVADLDVDGRADVVTLHGGWTAAGVYRQQVNGTLAPEELFDIPYATHYNPHGLAVGDVNGDGSPDVVLADYNNGLVVLRNTTVPTAVPNAPTLTAAVAATGSVALSWSPPATNGGAPSGYGVYRGTTSGGETLLAILGTARSYVDSTIAAGTAYYYRVSGVNSLGVGPGSNELSTRVDTTAPSKPANLKLAVAGTNQLALDWDASTDNVGVTGYRVYRNGVLVATAAATEAVDPGLAANTSYVYTVRAIDAAGNASAASTSVTAKTGSIANGSTGTLAGAVYDATGRPLANAVVSVTIGSSVKTAKTNGSGTWKLSSIPSGTYSFGVALAGFRSQTASMTASAGRTVLAVMLLAPA